MYVLALIIFRYDVKLMKHRINRIYNANIYVKKKAVIRNISVDTH